MKKKTAIPRLSELEQASLGAVWRLGEATAYRVRQQFVQSPSTVFSGSAGAIYPLLRKLESRGLLASTPQSTGKRASRAYRLTPDGKAALLGWLEAPMGQAEASDFDPIRLRLHFIAAMPKAKRLRFLENAERALAEQEAVLVEYCKGFRKEDDPIEHYAARGGLVTLRARRRWIREIKDDLSGR